MIDLQLYNATDLALMDEWRPYDPKQFCFAPLGAAQYSDPVVVVDFHDDPAGDVIWESGCGPADPSVDEYLLSMSAAAPHVLHADTRDPAAFTEADLG